MKVIVAHGTFDILHYGHLRYLENSKSLGDYLIVLVTSDRIAERNGKKNLFNEKIRCQMVASLKCVDCAIIRDESVSGELLKKMNADVFSTVYKEFLNRSNMNCEIKILEKTDHISSTQIKQYLKGKFF